MISISNYKYILHTIAKILGKGHEKEDLDLMLKKLEHWAYRLYPKFKFEDCLKKIESLGKKRSVMVCYFYSYFKVGTRV